MLQKNSKLCLFAIERIEFPDKTTGDAVVKFKHSFFDQENKLVVGYLDDDDAYADCVADVGEYDESKSFVFPWQGREFDGEIKWKLLPQT